MVRAPLLLRFALSRTREYLADAGAVELTKNPDALISALLKIERHASIPEMPSRMSAFFIENPLAGAGADLLSTHPPMSERIAALQAYAGGHAPLPDNTAMLDNAPQASVGPWGAAERP